MGKAAAAHCLQPALAVARGRHLAQLPEASSRIRPRPSPRVGQLTCLSPAAPPALGLVPGRAALSPAAGHGSSSRAAVNSRDHLRGHLAVLHGGGCGEGGRRHAACSVPPQLHSRTSRPGPAVQFSQVLERSHDHPQRCGEAGPTWPPGSRGQRAENEKGSPRPVRALLGSRAPGAAPPHAHGGSASA